MTHLTGQDTPTLIITGYRIQDTGYFIISFLRNLNVEKFKSLYTDSPLRRRSATAYMAG